jgi:2',3'-cyclic-nucleotide 2'-phosphodiesterase (5'-nucleotidase family)
VNILSRVAVTAAVATVALLGRASPSAAQALRASKDPKITILQTTDLHHHANGADHVGLDVDPDTGRGTVGSYARIASYITNVRFTAGHPVVLVDSGDWTMGTLYDLTLGGVPLALGFMKLMQYDCVTLGNHEFDYTSTGLARILAAAQKAFGFRTPIVASNMSLGGNTDLAPYVGACGTVSRSATSDSWAGPRPWTRPVRHR